MNYLEEEEMNFINRMGRTANVLLAEDNEPDQRMVQRGFAKAKLSVNIFIVEDGEECLDYLYHRGKYTDIYTYPYPDLLLLDINMPKINGLEVLRQIRSNNEFCTLPTIILTTSDQERDVIASYTNGSNAYITKPVDAINFLETIRKLEEFWFELVIIPSIR